jgi:hypothetical protein
VGETVVAVIDQPVNYKAEGKRRKAKVVLRVDAKRQETEEDSELKVNLK